MNSIRYIDGPRPHADSVRVSYNWPPKELLLSAPGKVFANIDLFLGAVWIALDPDPGGLGYPNSPAIACISENVIDSLLASPSGERVTVN